jgi:hypothetical protein
LVLFVGEALVGNEAVDQLVKFNQALADHSAADNPHTIDGIVLTKFDTIDDKVIALVLDSIPILLDSIHVSDLNVLTILNNVPGGSSHLHDIHHRAANRFRRHWTNIF